jgi:tRNA(adenine34) deaminase
MAGLLITRSVAAAPGAPLHTDEMWMEEALREALRAQAAGEVPVGAVIVCEGAIVGRGHNRNLLDNDPTAHAEIAALREAGRAVGNHRLLHCEMFVTIEPCAMCAGALVHARLKRLVYGADDPKAGAVSSVLKVLNHPQMNHQMEVTAGVLAGRCAEMVQAFFRERRG